MLQGLKFRLWIDHTNLEGCKAKPRSPAQGRIPRLPERGTPKLLWISTNHHIKGSSLLQHVCGLWVLLNCALDDSLARELLRSQRPTEAIPRHLALAVVEPTALQNNPDVLFLNIENLQHPGSISIVLAYLLVGTVGFATARFTTA